MLLETDDTLLLPPFADQAFHPISARIAIVLTIVGGLGEKYDENATFKFVKSDVVSLKTITLMHYGTVHKIW